MVSFDNTDNSVYHQYSRELQALYVESLRYGDDHEKADAVEVKITEKIIEAMLDWDLGRSDIHALGRLLNLCENRECPPDSAPEMQYLPKR